MEFLLLIFAFVPELLTGLVTAFTSLFGAIFGGPVVT